MTPYYEHAGITIYHGDCRDVLPLVKADVVVTDPPYGVQKAEWDDLVAPSEWLPTCTAMARTSLVTPGISAMWKYPAPAWVASYSFPGGTKRAAGGGFNVWEPVLVYGRVRFVTDHRMFPPIPSLKVFGHATPKPLAPWMWLVASISDAGETIIDPFMGSGTTLVAAKQLGRRAIGIEISEAYCEIAAKRLSQEVLDFGAGAPTPPPAPEQGALFDAP